MQTKECNIDVCDVCIENKDTFRFSEIEIKVRSILSQKEKIQMCNIELNERHDFLKHKGEEYEVC